MNWDDKAIEELKDLLNEGLSMSRIALQMGRGLTRNAVLGKVHRLGLTQQKRPSGQGSRPRPAGPSKQPKALQVDTGPLPPLLDAAGHPFTMRNAGRSQCKWIAGESSMDAEVCGHPTRPASPWCDHHFARVHNAIASAEARKAAAAKESAQADKARGRTRATGNRSQ
jgi:GcrA cell cycle regulator